MRPAAAALHCTYPLYARLAMDQIVDKGPLMSGAPSGILNFLARFFRPELQAWRGQRPLPHVFWGYGVFASLILIALNASALKREQLLLQQSLIFFSAIYTVWILVAIWRCSANAAPSWGRLARALTIAWTLNTTLVLFFLQLDLLNRLSRS